jgi:hypothetical protein
MLDSEPILVWPTGDATLPSLGERFAVELPSGQATVTVPLETPPGRNGLQPDLALSYASGGARGPFGVGWSLPLPCVRKDGERFFLDGAELVAVGGGRYRPRADDRFCRIARGDAGWEIRERNGRMHHLAPIGNAWQLARTVDPFNHRIEYRWDGERLASVRYLEHGRANEFLVAVTFKYEGARCVSICVATTAPVRTYHLEHAEAQNGFVLLRKITVEGHDGDRSEQLPPLTFDYSEFDPSRRRFFALPASALARAPARAFASVPADFPKIPITDARVKIADMTGDGRPDVVIVRDRSVEYWPALADRKWGERVRMAEAPPLPGYDPRRVLLGDVDGDGVDDLVYVGDNDVTIWINRGGRAWSPPIRVAGTPRPDGEVRLHDPTGAGASGVLWRTGDKSWFLDISGGARPYLLRGIDNGRGVTTKIGYTPSTSGPTPIQLVTRVEERDAVGPSRTLEYRYHEPRWKGGVYRGFGRVDRVEGSVETRTFFGDSGKSAGRRVRSETWRDGNAEVGEWTWGAPGADGVYGVVLTAERHGERVTRWGDFDPYGQPRAELTINEGILLATGSEEAPRPLGVRPMLGSPIEGGATLTLTRWASREDGPFYLVDRPARVTTWALDGAPPTLEQALEAPKRLLGQTVCFYDGQPWNGLPLGQLGKYGALMRTERLAFPAGWLADPPPYLNAQKTEWTEDYPKSFRSLLPSGAGYVFRSDNDRETGFWIISERRRYDFQEAGTAPRGRVTVRRDALERDTSIQYDAYDLLPAKVSNPVGLATQAVWDYRLFRPKSLLLPNNNRSAFRFSPLGRLEAQAQLGRPGDESATQETRFELDLAARPAALRTLAPDGTLSMLELFDGRGRLLQTRTPAAEVSFPPLPPGDDAGDAIGARDPERVIVDGTRLSRGWAWEPLLAAAPTSAPTSASTGPSGIRDLLGRRWGDERRPLILDAAGRPVEERGPGGALVLRAFDALGREVRRWARDRAGEPATVRVWRVYGDSIDSGLPVQRAAEANLLGRLYRQYDEAGLVTYRTYDAEGRIVERARQPFSEETLALKGRVDWQPHANLSLENHAKVLVDERAFVTRFRWDARGRLVSTLHPEDFAGRRREVVRSYDREGRVERVELDGSVLIAQITYDPDGRRLLMAYGNGVLQRWARDEAGRILRLRTEKYEAAGPLELKTTGETLQDYLCGWDENGRLVRLGDYTPEAGIANRPSFLERSFRWDDEGHLLAATGRESGRPPDWPWDDEPRSIEPVQMRAVSDELDWQDGQPVRMRHDAGRGSWKREWVLDEQGRVEKLVMPDGFLRYAYDASGAVASESSVRHFTWDHAGRLATFRWGEASEPPTIELSARYDADGARVITHVRRAEGAESTIAVDGLEHQRRGTEDAGSWLHVMLGDQPIASVRSGPPAEGEPEAAQRWWLEETDGSISLVVDESGAVLGREGYSAFGETRWGSFKGARFRWRGWQRDPVTGLYFRSDGGAWAPWLGRYLSPTPEPKHEPERGQPRPAVVDATEIYRIPMTRGADHGERVPDPRPSHRPESQTDSRSPRRGVGQGADLH